MAIVMLSELKAELGITDDADDAMITAKIDEAQAYIEQVLGYEIEVQFETVPADLKAAVKMQASHLFENREATVGGVSLQLVPNGVDDILRERRSYGWDQ